MLPRRVFLAAACLLPFSGHARSTFIGQWRGDVDGIGKARLIVTAIKPDGQVESRIEFELQSLVSSFGNKPDSIKNTNCGVVSGSTLTIDSALGGRYDLVLNGSQLSGTYSRGTTFRGPASFRKS